MEKLVLVVPSPSLYLDWTHWKMIGGVVDCREGTYFQFQAWLNLFFVDFSDLSEATPQSSCIIDIARSRYILRTVFWWSSKSWCLFKLFISVEYIFYGLTSFSSCVVCKFFVVYCVSTWELPDYLLLLTGQAAPREHPESSISLGFLPLWAGQLTGGRKPRTFC